MTMTTFREKLHETARKKDSWVCVGLDPDPAKIPAGVNAAESIESFLFDIIDRTKDVACAYKPNAAFFDALGDAGFHTLDRVCDRARKHAPVILDAKRGDIGNTARAYASWGFDVLRADAMTVSPYMGRDSVQPFLDHADKGTFLLARTSNAGGADLQALMLATGEPLYERVVRLAAREWNGHGNVGLVAGATSPDELRRIRQLAGPDMLLLVPGVGAQGGSAEHAVRFGANELGDNAIVNASRSILYASDPAKAAADLRDELNKYRPR